MSCSFLRNPLSRHFQAGTNGGAAFIVLLDALDEADHLGKGFDPVLDLIAHRFKDLSGHIRFVLTSRVEQAERLSDWNPRLIKPDERANRDDMLILVKAKVKALSLSKTGRINPLHYDQAVKLILDKSKGQVSFIIALTLTRDLTCHSFYLSLFSAVYLLQIRI